MPRKPKPKNTLSAGERAALYEAEQAEKRAQKRAETDTQAQKKENKAETVKAEPEKVKIELPKPQFATVKVDLSMPIGQIKPMHGMCNGPISYGADISSLFREIGVPYVRFDETDTAISSYAVDISRIFRDPAADPGDPESYDFSYTDKYVRAAYNSGAEVIFRLGESFDRMHSGKIAASFSDINILVEVCANIVRHYNDYFANGYAYGIKYFEIWNHADTYSNDSERAFEIYRRVASALKLMDRELKVGGMCFQGMSAAIREFIKYCRKTRSPLDFLTISSFNSHPRMLSDSISELLPLLHNLGFSETEIIVGAWSYIDSEALGKLTLERVMSGTDTDCAEAKKKLFDSQGSVKGAAYALAFMISLGRLREVAKACFYDAEPNISPWCAISDRFGNPQKPFYAFKAYGEIFRAGNEIYTVCEEMPGYADSGIYAIAAQGREEYYILISSFDGCGMVDLRLDAIPSDIYTADIYMLDGVKNMTLADQIPISGDKKRLILNISKYGAAMVKLY